MAPGLVPATVAGSIGISQKGETSLLSADALLPPDTCRTYARYLHQAEFEVRHDGVLVYVPTSFQASALQSLLPLLEQITQRRVLGIQIRRPAAPAFQQQMPLPLPVRRPEGESPLETEKKKRIAPPPYLRSPAFADPLAMLENWARGLFRPGARSQCLWVHGASGSGKTYLLRQLNELIPLDRRLVTVDVSSFFHEWRRSIEGKDMSFARKYRRETDVLVLEGLDELARMPGTQHELLLTAQALLERGCYFVVSSEKSPLALQPLLDASLHSRLNSGLEIEMPRPDRPFKESLWRHLISQHGMGDSAMDLMLLEKLFDIPASTARAVHSLFINVISRLSIKRQLDMADIHELMGRHQPMTYVPTANGSVKSPASVLEEVAKICGLGPAAIQGRVRRPEICLARNFVCLALSRHCGLTNAAIAVLIEKDPSTISHSLKTIETDIEQNRRVAQQWAYICSQLGISAS